jgi:hypothetical protein
MLAPHYPLPRRVAVRSGSLISIIGVIDRSSIIVGTNNVRMPCSSEIYTSGGFSEIGGLSRGIIPRWRIGAIYGTVPQNGRRYDAMRLESTAIPVDKQNFAGIVVSLGTILKRKPT